MSILTLLCTGVLLAACTLNALAATTTVNAVVPAAPLTAPAVITNPASGAQTSVQSLTVQGTCPDDSYVTLSDNSLLAGVVNCSSGAFSISLDLSPGSNELQAQDYNITNAAGPVSSPVIVTYTPPSTSSPSQPAPGGRIAVPTRLLVTRVGGNTPYGSSKNPLIVSLQPTLTGVAPPGSKVAIAVDSNPPACTTTANSQGYWSCTLPNALPPGIHTVHITATTPQGNVLTSPVFTIKAAAGAGSQTIPGQAPFRITTTYAYHVNIVGQPVSYTLSLSGGTEPYAFTVIWGDGAVQTILRQTSDDFTISHTYGWINAANATRVIKIQAVDASGQAGTLQLQAILRNPAYHASAAGTTSKLNWLWRFFAGLRPWLWLLWPGYIIVLLMVLSFWLGERQEIALLLANKKKRIKPARHAHARH
ncbi:MAG TPA: Ig-like domain-containing protein [Candidatus Saccharimonadales bacterium]